MILCGHPGTTCLYLMSFIWVNYNGRILGSESIKRWLVARKSKGTREQEGERVHDCRSTRGAQEMY